MFIKCAYEWSHLSTTNRKSVTKRFERLNCRTNRSYWVMVDVRSVYWTSDYVQRSWYALTNNRYIVQRPIVNPSQNTLITVTSYWTLASDWVMIDVRSVVCLSICGVVQHGYVIRFLGVKFGGNMRGEKGSEERNKRRSYEMETPTKWPDIITFILQQVTMTMVGLLSLQSQTLFS